VSFFSVSPCFSAILSFFHGFQCFYSFFLLNTVLLCYPDSSNSWSQMEKASILLSCPTSLKTFLMNTTKLECGSTKWTIFLDRPYHTLCAILTLSYYYVLNHWCHRIPKGSSARWFYRGYVRERQQCSLAQVLSLIRVLNLRIYQRISGRINRGAYSSCRTQTYFFLHQA
jgi:hypothetical protein